MKAYINGNMYEGTADEIVEFLNATKREHGRINQSTNSDCKIVNELVNNDEDIFLNIDKLSQIFKLSKKQIYVNTALKMCLMLANKNIKDCKYEKTDELETVVITMKNDYNYTIDVTADNLMTILTDVSRFMMYK